MTEPIQGAVLLRRFLDERGLSIPRFCEQHGIDRIQVQRVMNGERAKRVSVNFAKLIHDATVGEVPWDSWATIGESGTDETDTPETPTGTG